MKDIIKNLTLGGWIALVVALVSGAARADSFPAIVELSSLDGTNGFVLNGVGESDAIRRVGHVGDLNGDGISDVIIGAPNGGSSEGGRAGRAYVVFGDGDPFPASMDLSSLDGTNGFELEGLNERDELGFSVQGIGDVNADGTDDLIVTAPRADAGSRERAGQCYVVFGSDAAFPATFDLASLDGTNGFTLLGEEAFDEAGRATAALGDINGDDIDDFIVAAPFAEVDEGQSEGVCYVVFGSASGFPATQELSEVAGNNGFKLLGGEENGFAGRSVDGAGDINDDGIRDILIGANFVDSLGRDNAGESYVVFGSDAGFPASVELTTLDGTNGFIVNGAEETDLSGSSVAGLGDVNGDGIDDMIIGASDASPAARSRAGRCHVVFGTGTGFPATLDLQTLNAASGFVLNGATENQEAGSTVSAAGDVNGDGIADMMIGAPGNFQTGDETGTSYVVFGSRTGFAASMELADLTGADGFRLAGIDMGDYNGTRVSGAGDLNNDGVDDVITVADSADPGGRESAGEAYVVFGRQTCRRGGVNALAEDVADALFVNASAGHGAARIVEVTEGERIWASMVPPPLGGNGRYVVHANFGAPGGATATSLPFGVGMSCFPMLSPSAAPAAIWSNIGRVDQVGSSRGFDGQSIANPDRAPSHFLFLLNGDATHLPAGTTVSFQGMILDPGSQGSKTVSVTNAVVLEVRPAG